VGGRHRYDLCANGIENRIATKSNSKIAERTFKQLRETAWLFRCKPFDASRRKRSFSQAQARPENIDPVHLLDLSIQFTAGIRATSRAPEGPIHPPIG
jgi:hypothetical protein